MTRHLTCSGRGCGVDVLGHTDCGALACPSCGRGDSAAGVGDIAVARYSDRVYRCSCGCRWQPHAYGPPS